MKNSIHSNLIARVNTLEFIIMNYNIYTLTEVGKHQHKKNIELISESIKGDLPPSSLEGVYNNLQLIYVAKLYIHDLNEAMWLNSRIKRL